MNYFITPNSDGKEPLKEIFLVDDRAHLVASNHFHLVDRKRGATDKDLRELHSTEWDFVLSSFRELAAIRGYLRGDDSKFNNVSSLKGCIEDYCGRLVSRKGSLVSHRWYLHFLSAHLITHHGDFLEQTHRYNCEAQERMNGCQVKEVLAVTQIHQSSYRILMRSALRV